MGDLLFKFLFFIKIIFILIVGSFLSCSFGYSQHQNLPLNFQLSQKLDYNLSQKRNPLIVHSASKPINQAFCSTLFYNSIYNDTGKYYYAFTEKLFQKNLLSIEEEGLKLVADPLFNFSYGRTSPNDSLYKISTNTRGVRVAGDITKYFSFETKIFETQIYYPEYLDSIADEKKAAFGFGRSKVFKDKGHDVAMSTGYISYSPSKQINLQFGQGKHFYGNGYRSLLLSDNASPAPYFSFTTQFLNNKIQYKNINSWIQSLARLPATNSAEALFKRKGASYRTLSFAPSQKLQFGLFEGVIYQNYIDSIGQVPLSGSFYIPIIGASTLLNGLNTNNNSLLGFNINYRALESLSIYSQLMIDDSKKKGLQFGIKWFEFAKIKNSWVQLEYNSVEAYSYSNSPELILQSYSHSNQELAHPLGANFSELIFLTHIEKQRWIATGKIVFSAQDSFSKLGLGSNILIPETAPLSDIIYSKKVSLSGLEVAYLFNRKTNMQLFGSYYYRNESIKNNFNSIINNNFESFWQIGFRTTLLNFYHDI